MSFFARAANLIKGGLKSVGRPSKEDELRLRAIEEELAKETTPRVAVGRPKRDTREPAPEPHVEKPPERDANGNVKRTL